MLNQDEREAKAAEKGMKYYNCAEIVAGYLGLPVRDWRNRIAMRQALQKLVKEGPAQSAGIIVPGTFVPGKKK